MIRPSFRNTLLARFKKDCKAIEEETRRAIRVDDRSHYREDGSFFDAVYVTIYPTMSPHGIPLKHGFIHNFGKLRYGN